MVQARRMAFRHVDEFWMGFHTAEDPTDEEWTRQCAEVARLRRSTRGVIIYTEGGGPSSQQRELLRAALQDTPQPVAVLTHSAAVRGIITSLNWFFKAQTISAFSPADLDGALAFLARQAGAPRRDVVIQELRALAKELGVTPPKLTRAA